MQAAVDASHDGDTVRVPAGRFPGGVTITKSITLAGAGARATTLVGGEHVLTIGSFGSESAPPTVNVSGLTLTGGVAHSTAYSATWIGVDGVFAGGAGLAILADRGVRRSDRDALGRGRHREHSDTVGDIRTRPRSRPALLAGLPDRVLPVRPGLGCRDRQLRPPDRGALAGHREHRGGIASDADGGGIANHLELTVDHSSVDGNAAVGSVPNGRFAEGGGIFSEDNTTLTVRNSSVSGNRASLTVGFPELSADGTLLETLANAGGIRVGRPGDGDHPVVAPRPERLELRQP